MKDKLKNILDDLKLESNKKTKFDYNNCFKKTSMQLALMLMSYLLLVLVLFTLFQFLKLSNTLGLIQVISIILPIIIYLLNSNNDKKKKVLIISIYLLILLVLPFVFEKTYDLTYDGNSYHKTAIAYIKNGWNPIYETSFEFQTRNNDIIKVGEESNINLWIEHYPKATWILSANIYNMTGNIESGKCITLILTIVLAIIVYNALRALLSKSWSLMIAFLIAFNPITLSQIFSYYLDSIMGICFIIELLLLFMINPIKKQNKSIWLALISICTIFVNLKFTGLLYSGVIAAVFYFYWFFKYRKEKDFWNRFIEITRNFIIVFGIAIFFVGANSYIKNTIDHKNPLYPLFGEDKVDIITTMQPKMFGDMNQLEKFMWSLFSQTENVTYTSGDPKLKLPFVLYRSEIDELLVPDVRIGGFGPFFAMTIIFSIIVFAITAVKLYKNEKKNIKYITLTALAVVITMILVGESWWARYVPQFYLFPIGTIILTLYTSKYFKNKILPSMGLALVIGAIILNTSIFIKVEYTNLKTFSRVEKDLKIIEKMDNPKIKLSTSDLFGYLYTLEDRNIEYQLVDEINEDNLKYMYQWRLQVEIPEENVTE